MDRGLRLGSLTLKAGAISNFVAALPALVAYDQLMAFMVDVPPNYPFLVWIWAAMGAVWGIFMWEISGDLVGSARWLKYLYMEKGLVFASVLVAYLQGAVPVLVLVFSLLTDVLWIVLIALVHARIVEPLRARQRT